MTLGVAVQCALIVMVLLFIDVSSSCRIQLYQHSDHRGALLADRNVGNGDHTCFNLPGSAYNQATSVNTGGCCFILFSSVHCQGHSAKVGPGVPGCYNHGNLGDCNFNDQTKSYKIC